MTKINELQVGDRVAIYYTGILREISNIERVTKTQYVIGNLRFSRIDGSQVGGDSYSRYNVTPLTHEIEQEVKRRRAIKFLSDLEWSRVGYGDLVKIIAIVTGSESRNP